jgi:hypothetical protein
MKKTLLIVFALIIGLNVFGQRRRGNMNRIPQANREPTEQEIANHKRKLEDRKKEYIANFITTLEADDFQKEIIKQYLNSYFEERVKLSKIKFERTFDRDTAIKKLDDSHFIELEELISEADMGKIKEMIKGDFDEKEVKKEKKKKKKRKKRNKDKG